MKAKVVWKFGGDSISLTALGGEVIAAADGGRAKSAIFAALKDAGISPKGRRLNDDLGTPHNPAPLGADRYWVFDVEITEETVAALRNAQALVDAEYEAWHQDALKLIRANGFHTPVWSDSALAELVRAGLKDTLKVVPAPANDACVYWKMPPERIISITDDDLEGMSLQLRRDNGGVAYFWEKYSPAIIQIVLSACRSRVRLCYERPRRSTK